MENKENLKYMGRIGQTFVYLLKICRTFIYQNDWKVLPMSAVIAAMVSMAVGGGLFLTMEGTLQGALALACVGIWNGFFNSIQVICRERAIIKREHRAGLHITSYVLAHLIFQILLCAAQTGITIYVLHKMGVVYPSEGIILDTFIADFAVTLFLITYTADVLALMISAMVQTTTTAMTVMPFMLIAQLVFAGFFTLPGYLKDVSDLMITKWGLQGLCVLGRYNELPAVVIWNRMRQAGANVDLGIGITLKDAMDQLEQSGYRETVQMKLGQASAVASYNSTMENLLPCWQHLIIFTIVFAAVTVVFLEFIDRDKR